MYLSKMQNIYISSVGQDDQKCPLRGTYRLLVEFCYRWYGIYRNRVYSYGIDSFDSYMENCDHCLSFS